MSEPGQRSRLPGIGIVVPLMVIVLAVLIMSAA